MSKKLVTLYLILLAFIALDQIMGGVRIFQNQNHLNAVTFASLIALFYSILYMERSGK